jgi:hypothetical protein
MLEIEIRLWTWKINLGHLKYRTEFQPWDNFPISYPKPRTKGHAPNQLPNLTLTATHQSYYMPRTKSVTIFARPRYGWRSARRSCPARRVRNDPWAGACKGIPPHGHPLARPVYFRPRVLSRNKRGHAPNFIFSRRAITPAREGTPEMVPFFLLSLGGSLHPPEMYIVVSSTCGEKGRVSDSKRANEKM